MSSAAESPQLEIGERPAPPRGPAPRGSDPAIRVLLVEDSAGDADLARIALDEASGARFRVQWVQSLAETLIALRREHPDVVLLDLNLPDSRGRETLDDVLAADPAAAVVVLTGIHDENAALDGVRAGAQDYLAKQEMTSPVLTRALRYAIERKRLREELRSAQRLEALGRLAGGIAHDFNNLLQVAIGMVEQLRTDGELPATAADTLDEFDALFSRGAELARKLLLFARREAPRRSPHDLVELAAAVTKMLQRLVRDNVQLRVNLPSEPIVVLADRGQLEQVIANLVINGSEAMPNGGALDVEVSHARNRARLSVKDTGIGIAPDVLSRLYEPFFSTKGGGNSGLGLAVVHGIVTEHGGTIDVESRLGAGTRFEILLPEVVPTPSTGADGYSAPDRVAARGAGERVLLVDDQPLLRRQLANSLERLGYRAVAAVDGESALEVEGPFDALVTDVSLPGIDGDQLAARLRQRWPGLAVLLISGYSPTRLEVELLEGVRFLQKPFALTTFANALQEVLAACRRH